MPTGFGCVFHEDLRTFTVSGTIDGPAAAEIRRQVIARATVLRDSLTLDLSDVQSLSGAAVGIIASARAELRGHFLFLKIVAAQGSIASRILPDSGMAVFEA